MSVTFQENEAYDINSLSRYSFQTGLLQTLQIREESFANSIVQILFTKQFQKIQVLW